MSSPDRVVDHVVHDRLHLVARRPAEASAAAPVPRREHAGAAGASAPVPDAPAPAPDDGMPWLPVRPPDVEAAEPPAAGDVADVVTRRRAEALATAAAGYAAAYGHPLDHVARDGASPGARWRLSTRQALVAGVAVLVLAAGIVVRAWIGVPAPPVALDGATGPGAAASATPATASGAVTAVGPAGTDPVGSDAARAGVAPVEVAGGAGTGTTAGPAAPAGGPVVVVHVVGRVVAPGVLSLPAGSRVADAVTAAGGPTPEADLTAVNLARPLVDGEQIRVPAPGDPPPDPAPAGPAAGGAAGGGAGAAPVSLNAADLAALDALPGIGPVLAGRILDWRTENGPFRSVDELGEVAGIGDALLARLRPLVRV